LDGAGNGLMHTKFCWILLNFKPLGQCPLERPTGKWEENIKSVLGKYVVRMVSGLNWLRIQSSSGIYYY
jgi:hypothetical protein